MHKSGGFTKKKTTPRKKRLVTGITRKKNAGLKSRIESKSHIRAELDWEEPGEGADIVDQTPAGMKECQQGSGLDKEKCAAKIRVQKKTSHGNGYREVIKEKKGVGQRQAKKKRWWCPDGAPKKREGKKRGEPMVRQKKK